MTEAVSHRDERIDLRLSSDLKALFTRAAAYSGMSLSAFLLSVAADRARAIVADQETLTLSARDWEAFLGALDQAERPRPRLEAAARRYRQRRGASDAA